jgi:glutamine amidotransferase
VRPAWSDENLKSICAHVRAGLFFAHVRATTGSAVSRVNCHPFAHGRHMFMHNGQIGGFSQIKRRVESLIPDELYPARLGSTDSEAIFLIALANGLTHDPLAAMAKTLAQIEAIMREAKIEEALRLTAAVADGETLYAFRWATDRMAPSLYYQEANGDLLIVSEPLDSDREGWIEIPQACALIARPGRTVEKRCLQEAMLKAA